MISPLRYVLIDGQLYKKSVDGLLLKCLSKHESMLVMAEVHEGICVAHQAGVKMRWLIRRHGYQKGGEWVLDYVTKKCWKPLTAKEIVLRIAIKGHRATLLRSPDRVIGLGDAMRRDTHFKSFTLADS